MFAEIGVSVSQQITPPLWLVSMIGLPLVGSVIVFLLRKR